MSTRSSAATVIHSVARSELSASSGWITTSSGSAGSATRSVSIRGSCWRAGSSRVQHRGRDGRHRFEVGNQVPERPRAPGRREGRLHRRRRARCGPTDERQGQQLRSHLAEHGPQWLTTDVDPSASYSINARVLIAMGGDGTASGTMLKLIDPA